MAVTAEDLKKLKGKTVIANGSFDGNGITTRSGKVLEVNEKEGTVLLSGNLVIGGQENLKISDFRNVGEGSVSSFPESTRPPPR